MNNIPESFKRGPLPASIVMGAGCGLFFGIGDILTSPSSISNMMKRTAVMSASGGLLGAVLGTTIYVSTDLLFR